MEVTESNGEENLSWDFDYVDDLSIPDESVSKWMNFYRFCEFRVLE